MKYPVPQSSEKTQLTLHTALVMLVLIVLATMTSCIGSRLTPTVVVNTGQNPILIVSSEGEKIGRVEPNESVLFHYFYPTRNDGQSYFVVTEYLPGGKTQTENRYVSAEEFRSNFVNDALFLTFGTPKSVPGSVLRQLD